MAVVTLLVFLAATGLGVAAALAIRRRRGPGGALVGTAPVLPDDPALEAELQEIIAEERARAAHVEHERSPAELAAARDDPG